MLLFDSICYWIWNGKQENQKTSMFYSLWHYLCQNNWFFNSNFACRLSCFEQWRWSDQSPGTYTKWRTWFSCSESVKIFWFHCFSSLAYRFRFQAKRKKIYNNLRQFSHKLSASKLSFINLDQSGFITLHVEIKIVNLCRHMEHMNTQNCRKLL